ncbi:DUF6644 family protein [Aliidiomarina maris]|uniref:DUF2214 domain-containing protein n=1 Tax=Aliidiomarina maris TaxID=531312 RepID=A0A327WMW1_9GAMM|nr:DUF6644 family protein [Aliidiomarina maris]MCL5050581.1 DUF2214 domain-containing protein [Bacillota bacterium]RAJ93279.1 hypothetical protein B0I24_1206 [Aliidiomarina maris]RUO18535.1 DUF2214 domain-containing protein [Aliidiomarina maris]
MLEPLWQWLAQSALASFLRSSDWAYPALSASHIIALGTLIGTVIVMDLRVLGVIRRIELVPLVPLMSQVAAVALVFALLTGVVLFSVQPNHYLSNDAFLFKLACIALALLNALLVHANTHWRALRSNAPATHAHGLLKLGAALSLILWLSAVFAGRWIAFV